MTTSTPKKRGKPQQKAPGGLDKGLFIRANQDLLDKLDAYRDRQQAKFPNGALSRADVARAALWEAIERSEKESK